MIEEKQKIRQRQKLRNDLLEEAYRYHFSPTSNTYLTIDLNGFREEREILRAYDYLDGTGLISIDVNDDTMEVTITPHGIDYVENRMLQQ